MAGAPFKARHGTIKFSTGIAPDTATPFTTEFSGSATNLMKNISLSPPEGAVDKIDLLGETSNFQNALLEDKSFGLAKCSGTVVLDGDEDGIRELMTGATGVAITGGYSRYQVGSSASGKTRVTEAAVMVSLTDGTEVRSFVLDNVRFTKIGDIKLTGADGHWEYDFEVTCLPQDWFEENKD